MLKPGPRPLTRKLLTMLSRARHVESQSLPFNGSDITEKADSIERDSKLTLDRYAICGQHRTTGRVILTSPRVINPWPDRAAGGLNYQNEAISKSSAVHMASVPTAINSDCGVLGSCSLFDMTRALSNVNGVPVT